MRIGDGVAAVASSAASVFGRNRLGVAIMAKK